MITQEQAVWKSRYEQLRQQALKPNDTLVQDRWGLGLLIHEGVAGWMRVWRDPSGCCETAAVAQAASGPPRGSWQHEATLLLANMALSHCQLKPSSSL
jgi:hypothetical protein